MNDAVSSVAAMHPLIERLFTEHAFARVDPASLEALVAPGGATVLFFSEDPKQYKETLDLAVILPEIAKAHPGRFRVGVLLPADARALATRYGVRRWPALVMLRDGAYVGAIEGLRDWSDYLAETAALLEAVPTRPPIPLHVAGGFPACS